MKKIIVILLLTICSFARADDRSKALLEKMGGTLREWNSYKVEFSLRTDGTAEPVSGSYIVSGRKYRLTVEGRELVSDGTLKYEVNSGAREILIDNVNPDDRSILGNPTNVLDFSDEIFSADYGGRTEWKGRAVDKIILTPRTADGVLQQITLLLDTATALPAVIIYEMSTVSEPVEIAVDAIKAIPAPDDKEFRFDKSRYKGYDIIDFR